MELTLHPLAKTCRVTGRAFAEGDRVISRLVREPNGEIARHDVLASEDAAYERPPFIFCTWTIPFKAKRAEENPGRALKLTAENLFVTLADPLAEPDEANTPLLQFLALLLERKKTLRPRGLSVDGTKQVYEHAKTRQRYEVPAGTLDEAFFVKIQGQLDLLVGGPKKTAQTKPENQPATEPSTSPASESSASDEPTPPSEAKAEPDAPSAAQPVVSETAADERTASAS